MLNGRLPSTICSPRGFGLRPLRHRVLAAGVVVGWLPWASLGAPAPASEGPANASPGAAAPVVLKLHWYPQAQFFGEAGLTTLLARLHAKSVGAICEDVLRAVNEHRRHEGQDDVTLDALRRAEDVPRPAEAPADGPAERTQGG